MIQVTKLDNRTIVINADLIESIEETPDTILRLTTGRMLMVKESLSDVVSSVLDYRRMFPVYAIPSGEREREQR
jgi:flagellar protein FlbD